MAVASGEDADPEAITLAEDMTESSPSCPAPKSVVNGRFSMAKQFGSGCAEDMTENNPSRPAPKSVANGRFSLSEQLGSGCFGEVWLGNDKIKEQIVAVKLELKGDTKQLANEYQILSSLKHPCQQQGFTEVFHFGREGEHHVCLVMELLGKSLEEWLAHCGGKFSVTTVALLGEQIVQRLEYLHSKCVIHRDIKPENFMMGTGARAHIVYLIDFGLSEFYYDEGQHASQIKDSLTGTARYASVNAHDKAQSRRDDLEATGHMLVFFSLGTLPWCGLPPTPGKEEFAQIREMKKAIKARDLCKGLPPELEDYVSYCRSLGYRQRPDYSRLRLLFSSVIQQLGAVQAHDLQWLQDDEEFNPDILVPLDPSPDIEQPDDAEQAGSPCRCCKRREARARASAVRQPLAAASGAVIGMESGDAESSVRGDQARKDQNPKEPARGKTWFAVREAMKNHSLELMEEGAGRKTGFVKFQDVVREAMTKHSLELMEEDAGRKTGFAKFQDDAEPEAKAKPEARAKPEAKAKSKAKAKPKGKPQGKTDKKEAAEKEAAVKQAPRKPLGKSQEVAEKNTAAEAEKKVESTQPIETVSSVSSVTIQPLPTVRPIQTVRLSEAPGDASDTAEGQRDSESGDDESEEDAKTEACFFERNQIMGLKPNGVGKKLGKALGHGMTGLGNKLAEMHPEVAPVP